MHSAKLILGSKAELHTRENSRWSRFRSAVVTFMHKKISIPALLQSVFFVCGTTCWYYMVVRFLILATVLLLYVHMYNIFASIGHNFKCSIPLVLRWNKVPRLCGGCPHRGSRGPSHSRTPLGSPFRSARLQALTLSSLAVDLQCV